MSPSLLRQALALAVAAAAMALAGAAEAEECHGAPTAVKVTIVADNLRTSQGLLAITLYQEHGFLKKGGSLKVWREPARRGGQAICMYLPAPGTYAFGVFQDLNSDHKLDYNLFRGPTEPWGFTNNPRAIWPLRFSRVAVPVGQGSSTYHVRLNY